MGVLAAPSGLSALPIPALAYLSGQQPAFIALDGVYAGFAGAKTCRIATGFEGKR